MKVPAVFFLRVFLLLSIVDVTFCLLNGAVLYSFFILTFNILISYVISLLAKLFGHYCLRGQFQITEQVLDGIIFFRQISLFIQLFIF